MHMYTVFCINTPRLVHSLDILGGNCCLPVGGVSYMLYVNLIYFKEKIKVTPNTGMYQGI